MPSGNGNGNGNGNKNNKKNNNNNNNNNNNTDGKLSESLGKAADIAKTLANWSPNKRTSIDPVEAVRSGQSGKQFTSVRGGEIDSLSTKERKRLEKLTSGYG